MKIFLIGLPGAGKSTFGRKLADERGLSFCDLDTMIVSRQNRSIPEIFNQEGEETFRKIELAILKEAISPERDVVVSCGGGTPCFFDNMCLMNESGITVYLKVPLDTIAMRLKSSAGRPLIQGPDPHGRIEELLSERSQYYELAQIVLDDWSKSYDAQIRDLMEILERKSKGQ